jgi:hypothetical protein
LKDFRSEHLSENSQSEQNVDTRRSKKSQLVFPLLAPASREAAALAQPTNGALNHLAMGGVPQLAANKAFFDRRFVSSMTMFDMREMPFLSQDWMDIFIIIVAFVGPQMLLNLLGVGAHNDDRNDQVVRHLYMLQDIEDGNLKNLRFPYEHQRV